VTGPAARDLPRAAAGRSGLPTVEVVVPCYNYGHLLRGCLDSILGQDGVEAQVLVVDDASPDGSGDVAERLAADDPRVRVTRHAANKGHIATYNDGLAETTGDYVVLLSADDLVAPGAFRRATELMEANPDVGFVYGFSRYFTEPADLPARPGGRATARVVHGPQWIERRLHKATNTISSPEVVVRGSLQRAVGGYRPDLPYSGDLEMWLRLAARADVGIITGVDQAYYRVHQQSMTRTSYKAEIRDLQQRYLAFATFLDEAGGSVADPPAARRHVGRVLGASAAWRAGRTQMTAPEQAAEVAEMERWALEVAPDVVRSPEYRALRLARRRGTRAATHPTVLATAVRRRIEEQLYWSSRRRRGV
jgi:hypothetical protein